jgi:TonB family protein
MPIYPEKALRARIRGLVVLRVLVSEEGVPLEIRVEQGARKDLTDAAVRAVYRWRFEPARKNGRPVRTFAIVRIPFEAIQFARTPFRESGALPVSSPTPLRRPSP